ncbi:arrestin domain-containing protein 3-like isoform X3 [Micropterus dolomieu]|uniref:arrestin domain-containing protein 3-like isoform X3 n=1 Tax=Micropterus dolomieu TaxID=147949 RepID=UPI001E8EBFCB|nr:arrestin domain-containing protein 3-like isoform X3 [Micropterus dolomieu]
MFQPTVKNFKISFGVVNDRNTFSSGDIITGHISFDLAKETNITSITMALTGRASVHWSADVGGGGRRRRRVHYSEKLDFFNFKSAIVQENSATGGTTKFQPGTHVYPFTCQLPQGDFPSAFRGVHGKIVYTLTVGFNRPWRMSKDFVTELNFVNCVDTNQPELWAPLSGSNNMTLCCLWCASGPITMTVSIEKKAFIPGESVKIICDFSNASSRTATPKVRLQQKQGFYTHNKAHKRMIFKNFASVTGQPISAHTSDVHTEIILTIPSSAMLTISNCSILEVEYFIEATLRVTAFPDLTVLFPIILCDTLVNTHPPPYLDLPSSFKSSSGKIVYTLEANLSRSMRVDSKANAQFTLIHKENLNSDPLLMTPQHSTIDKKMKLFTSGTVGMDVNIERTGFHQGEGMKGKRKVETRNILKEVGDAIPPSAGQTVTRTITISPTTCVSILNCNIIKVEYRLRVYLDVKYASDPEIKFPIVILPALQGPYEEHPPAYPTYGFEAFTNSEMPGGTSFPQNSTTSCPSVPPPSNGTDFHDTY